MTDDHARACVLPHAVAYRDGADHRDPDIVRELDELAEGLIAVAVDEPTEKSA